MPPAQLLPDLAGWSGYLLIAAFLCLICNNGHGRRSSCVLASVDPVNMRHVRLAKASAYGLQ